MVGAAPASKKLRRFDRADFEHRFRVAGEAGRGEGAFERRALEAEERSTGERFALEILRLHGEPDAAIERFLQVATSAGRLGVPHILRVVHAFRWDAEHVALVSEIYQGTPLSELLESKQKQSEEWGRGMVLALGGALVAAHAAGIVHGALTPRSVLVGVEGAAVPFKVRGFGAGALLDVEGAAAGARYRAPELARADSNPDEAADVYAFSAIAQACATLVFESPKPEARSLTLSAPEPTTPEQAFWRTAVFGLFASAEQRQNIASFLPDATDWPPRRVQSEFVAKERAPIPTRVTSDESRFDEDVQISVYRPAAIAPHRWYRLLAYAHLGEKRPEDPDDAPDPLEEVERRAATALGTALDEYRTTTQDTLRGLPEGGSVSFVPVVAGLEFNPPSRSFLWLESVHEESFSFRTQGGIEPTAVLRGSLAVFLGPILIAEVQMKFKVDAGAEANADRALDRASAYRKIFASYAREDTEIVKHFANFAHTFGDQFLIDVCTLRAGEEWNDAIRGLIRDAQVFQLFWSHHSMRSKEVRREWEYALSLQRERFVRPFYWERPMPRDEALGLPTPELEKLGFAAFGQLTATVPALPVPANLEDCLDFSYRSPAGTSPAADELEPSWAGKPAGRSSRSGRLVAGVAAAAALLLFVGLGSFLHRGSAQQSTSDAQQAAALEALAAEAAREARERAENDERLREAEAKQLELRAELAAAKDADLKRKLEDELLRVTEVVAGARARRFVGAGGPSGKAAGPFGRAGGTNTCAPGDPMCGDL